MPLGLMTAFGKATGNRAMWFGAQMMKFFERQPESGDPTEAVEIVGPPRTTLEDFARARR